MYRYVWFKSQTRPSDRHEYYAYTLCYVDDILVVHHDGMEALKGIDKFFKMKKGSVGDPDYYLGTKLRMMKLVNGVKAWGMSSSKYALAVVANVVTHIDSKEQGHMLPKRDPTPFKGGYQPEMDVSPELNPENATYYQSQIGTSSLESADGLCSTSCQLKWLSLSTQLYKKTRCYS